MELSTIALANTILLRAFANNIPTPPDKLQTMIYLVYTGYLQETGERLFSESFKCLYSGPALNSVQTKFGCFDPQPIRNYATDAEGNVFTLDMSCLAHLEHIINDVTQTFLPMPPGKLSGIIGHDNGAWHKAFRDDMRNLTDADILDDTCYSNPLQT